MFLAWLRHCMFVWNKVPIDIKQCLFQKMRYSTISKKQSIGTKWNFNNHKTT